MTKLSPLEILEKTGYSIYAYEAVLKNAPVGEDQEVKCFTIGRTVTTEELKEEYEIRGLEPANINSLVKIIDKYKLIATIWDDNGQCYVAFNRWRDERLVIVHRNDHNWHKSWWFCGTKKIPFNKPKPSLEPSTSELSDPLSLEKVIEVCNKAGLIVSKPLK